MVEVKVKDLKKALEDVDGEDTIRVTIPHECFGSFEQGDVYARILAIGPRGPYEVAKIDDVAED